MCFECKIHTIFEDLVRKKKEEEQDVEEEEEEEEKLNTFLKKDCLDVEIFWIHWVR